MQYNYCVFIGRFQPFHNSHLKVVKQGLATANELIIAVGSAGAARNIKNPFSYNERVEMIRACLSAEENARTHFIPARDYYYNDNHWMTNVQQKVNAITHGDESVCLIGKYKDSSSYYIKLFPQWEFVASTDDDNMHATTIRHSIFAKSTVGHGVFPRVANATPEAVSQWILKNFWETNTRKELCEEFEFIQKYKEAWKVAPYPVTFNTVDAIVIQSGHILVVRRKSNPGKGLIALPGGFLNQDETLETAAIRELKEETKIHVDKPILRAHIVDQRVFDHPNRSLRGRTITHGFCIKLPDGPLPEVKGSDDAEHAFWMPLMDVVRLEEQFYEDHAHIINYFVSRF